MSKEQHSKIRLLKIISGFGVESPLGGIEQFVINLCQALDHEKTEIKICGLWDYGSPFEKKWHKTLNKNGISTFVGSKWEINSPYSSFFQSVKSLRKQLDNVPIDIIHSHGKFSDIAAMVISHKKGGLLVRSVHDNFEWKTRPLRRLFLTNILYPQKFDVEIGISQNITRNLNSRPLAKYQNKTSLFINNAIDISRFNNKKLSVRKKKKELNIDDELFIIGAIGRLSEQKGFAYLIKAFHEVLKKYTSILLLLIGEGEKRAQLENLVKDLGIQSSIKFLGPRSDIVELYQIMDLFVSASLWEGLPTVIMESMASGIPVLATDIPGSNDLIKNQENGWLVPPGDSHQLAVGIIDAILNDQLRLTFSKKSIEFVKRYSIPAVARKHLALYTNMVNFKP